VGATHGAGTVVLINGIKMLAVPLWRSYLAGCILSGDRALHGHGVGVGDTCHGATTASPW